MLVFNIFKNVLDKDKQKKASMGNPPSLGLSPDTTASSIAVGAVATLADLGTSYAIGRGMYSDRIKSTSPDEGIESTMVESGVSVLGGETAASVVGHSMISLLGVSDSKEQLDVLGKRYWFTALAALPCFYHGYKRHGDSFMWGLGWGMFGDLGLAVSQNFGKPLAGESRKNPSEMLEEDDEEIVVERENSKRKRKMNRKHHRKARR